MLRPERKASASSGSESTCGGSRQTARKEHRVDAGVAVRLDRLYEGVGREAGGERRRVLGQQEGVSIVMVPDRGLEEDGEGEHVVKLVMVLKDECGLASRGE